MKFLQFTYQHYFQIVKPRKWNEISYIKSRPFLLDLEESRFGNTRGEKIIYTYACASIKYHFC